MKMVRLQELYLRISPDRFHYLKFILEAYDGLAILSICDQKKGVVVLRYSETMVTDLYGLLVSIAPRLISNT